MRPMVESYVLLIFPLCCFMTKASELNKLYIALTAAVISSFLNLFQTFQYQKSVLLTDKMTFSGYLFVFGKTKLSDTERKTYDKYLDEPNYNVKKPVE